ncbi:alpha/beta hydrolase fold domain-containing protein [Dactylosporangium sp. NPDC049525]|uniref:alpha/beta hydrolase fold domain-containing protein n=1 Tax=Dactylosporangium sp. NPDC049525 TaxID=3154730 RepID=UPI0034248490
MTGKIDPELVPGLANTLTAHLPDGILDVATVRAIDDQLRVETAPAEPPRVVALDGGLELRVHGPLHGDACLLWIHGGGMFLGSARTEDAFCADLADRLGVPVVAVDYRLAPEHPHPAPLHDCLAALHWCAGRSARVVVAGGSAGGGLAAALCLLARDEGGPPIAAAHLYYPMLDDRRDTPSALTDPPVWNRRLADLAWASYLGGRPADALAAPARATDLRGLPPTYLDVGDLDLFRDEDAAYAARLADAGVPVRFEVVPGAVHAFELIAPDAAISRATRERRLLALTHDLNGAA